MKKYLAFLMALALAGTFVACGDKDDDDDDSSSKKKSKTTTESSQSADDEDEDEDETTKSTDDDDEEETEATTKKKKPSATTEAATEAENEPKSEVKLLSTKTSKDRYDQDVLIVEYEWTNGTDDTSSFAYSVNDIVYQNGIECYGYVSIVPELEDLEEDNYYTKIKPGASVTVTRTYPISGNDGVEIIVTDSSYYVDSPVIIDEVIDLGGEAAYEIPKKLDKTSVTYVEHKLDKSYSDEDIVVVTFEFYNGEETPVCFQWYFDTEAYQDGVECEVSYHEFDEDETPEGYLTTASQYVLPGKKVKLTQAFELNDLESDVDIECKLYDYRNPVEYLSETLEIK